MSAPNAGDFDCARLQTINARMSAIVNPNEIKAAEYIADVEPLKMIREIQTLQLRELEDPSKDNVVKGIWMDDCDDTSPTECDPSCDLDGTEIGAQCKEFELDTCFEKSFFVTENKFRLLGNTVSQDEEIAIQMAKKIKLLDEEWAALGIGALDAMAGVNQNTSPYTVTSTHTNIPAAAWNPDLFGYFAVTKKRNKLPGMRLMLGGLMEQYFWKVQHEASTPEGQAAARKVASLGTVYSDSFVTEDVLNHKAAFLVSPAALAHVTQARHAAYGAGLTRTAQGHLTTYYTVTSSNTGIVYDVTYQLQCIAGGDWKHVWKIESRGAMLTNSTYCNADRTGVLKFRCAS